MQQLRQEMSESTNQFTNDLAVLSDQNTKMMNYEIQTPSVIHAGQYCSEYSKYGISEHVGQSIGSCNQ